MYAVDTTDRVEKALAGFEARKQELLEMTFASYANEDEEGGEARVRAWVKKVYEEKNKEAGIEGSPRTGVVTGDLAADHISAFQTPEVPQGDQWIIKRDIYAAKAAVNLMNGKHCEAALNQMQRTALWFDIPHPNGRDPRGESTFAAMGLLPAIYYCGDKLNEETRSLIDRFFLQKNFESMYESENHRLQHHTAVYLAGAFYPDRVFEWCGKTGKELADENEAWLLEFIRFRARESWGEFDSYGYLGVDFGCLAYLSDLSRSEELRRLSRMMLDVLLLDMAVDSRNALYGGAHGRIYPPSAVNAVNGDMQCLYYLYIGHPFREFVKGVGIPALLSTYRPSRIVLEVALGRVGTYENREAKHLHCIPEEQLPGRINKYTYLTDKYIVGAVNLQDDYPPDKEQRWYAHHEQHELDALILADPRAKIFTHHPGNFKEHNRWTGDIRCCCTTTYAWHNIAMSVYNITGENEFEYINAHFNRRVMENVQIRGNWVFGEKDGVYAALYGSNGFVWACDELRQKLPRSTEEHAQDDDEIELWSDGRRHACVIELSDAESSLEEFIQRIQSNTVEFDTENLKLRYTSGGHTLCMGVRDKERSVDGIPEKFPYENFDSPYVQSGWDEMRISVRGFTQNCVYDFDKGTVCVEPHKA